MSIHVDQNTCMIPTSVNFIEQIVRLIFVVRLNRSILCPPSPYHTVPRKSTAVATLSGVSAVGRGQGAVQERLFDVLAHWGCRSLEMETRAILAQEICST